MATNLAVALLAVPSPSFAGNRPELLEQPKRSEVRPDELEAYDHVMQRNACQKNLGKLPADWRETSRTPEFYNVLLHSPQYAALWKEMGEFFVTNSRAKGSYTEIDKIWVNTILSNYLGKNQWAHMREGLAAGLRPEAILAVMEKHEENLTDRERRDAQAIRHFIDGKFEDSDWKWVKGRFGPRGAVEWLSFIAFEVMVSPMSSAFDSDASSYPSNEQVARNVRDFMAGKLDVGHARGDFTTTFPYVPGKC